MRKKLALLTVFTILVLPFAGLMPRVSAAGVTLTVTPSSQAVSTAASVVLSFTPATTMANGSTINVAFSSSYTQTPSTLTNSDVVVTKTGDANFTSATSSGFSSTGFKITLTTGGNLNTSSAFTITMNGGNKLQTPSSAGNYTFSVYTSVGDQGAVLQYVGNANQVQITATVTPLLSLALRNTADTADLTPGTTSGVRACGMGILAINTTPTGPSTNACQYRIKATTNSASGMTLQYTSTSAHASGRIAIDATTTIADQTGGSTGDPLSTNNGYGVQMSVGSGLTRGATFGATAANFYTITSTSAKTVLTSTGAYNASASGDTTNTTLMTHGARIDATQPSGAYSHTVSYTLTASF
jgi:hypothetical protein